MLTPAPLLVQVATASGPRAALLTDRNGDRYEVELLDRSTWELFREVAAGGSFADHLRRRRTGTSLRIVGDDDRLLPPITHPDPARCVVAGTGLTHRPSAAARAAMHDEAGRPTPTSRLFEDGLAGGRPDPGAVGAEPEWFHKGDGNAIVRPGAPLRRPYFARDGGEEAELAVVHLIAEDGVPVRIGCAIGNEFSDHALERANYLYLAHSKLRSCAFGPALRVGAAPERVRGRVRILTGGGTRWERAFETGTALMTHSLENLEYHHFKYPGHRRPGDLHVHFLGAAALSFADGVEIGSGDVMEIAMEGFGPPLRNALEIGPVDFAPGRVRSVAP